MPFLLFVFCSYFSFFFGEIWSSAPGDIEWLTDSPGFSVGCLTVVAGVVRQLTVVAGVVGWPTTGARIIEWLDYRVSLTP